MIEDNVSVFHEVAQVRSNSCGSLCRATISATCSRASGRSNHAAPRVRSNGKSDESTRSAQIRLVFEASLNCARRYLGELPHMVNSKGNLARAHDAACSGLDPQTQSMHAVAER